MRMALQLLQAADVGVLVAQVAQESNSLFR
jgi:hypothetical protein